MSLNNDIFNAIIAKMMKEGNTVDLAKLMLSREEHLQVAQRYYSDLEADKKKRLLLDGGLWYIGPKRYDVKKQELGLPLFQKFATSIIPFIKELVIKNTHFEDYSFLNDIKQLQELMIETDDDYEHIKIISALSNLREVEVLFLNIKGLSLQYISSLPFSFHWLSVDRITFEVEPECDPFLLPHDVHLRGDEDLKNDFVFTRQNFEKYAAIFPNATSMKFHFHVKVIDDLDDLMKVSNINYEDEFLEINYQVNYTFYDYSGFPDSKVLKLLENDNNWFVDGCPYTSAFFESGYTFCEFPLAHEDLDRKIAKNYSRRIPVDSNGSLKDYRRLTICFGSKHELEFEVLKTTSVQTLFEAYAAIIEMNLNEIHFNHHDITLSHEGNVADKFQDGDEIKCYYGAVNEFESESDTDSDFDWVFEY